MLAGTFLPWITLMVVNTRSAALNDIPTDRCDETPTATFNRVVYIRDATEAVISPDTIVHLNCHLKNISTCIWRRPDGPVVIDSRYSYLDGHHHNASALDCSIEIRCMKDVDFTTWNCSVGDNVQKEFKLHKGKPEVELKVETVKPKTSEQTFTASIFLDALTLLVCSFQYLTNMLTKIVDVVIRILRCFPCCKHKTPPTSTEIQQATSSALESGDEAGPPISGDNGSGHSSFARTRGRQKVSNSVQRNGKQSRRNESSSSRGESTVLV